MHVHTHLQGYNIITVYTIEVYVQLTKMAGFWGNEDILQHNESIFVSHSVIWE